MKERKPPMVTTGLIRSYQARLFELLVSWEQKVLYHAWCLNLIANLIFSKEKDYNILRCYCAVQQYGNSAQVNSSVFQLTSII